MAGLTNKILPGDTLDADDVELNFDDLATQANDVKGWMVERGAVDTRHFTGTWRDVGIETAAGPQTGTGSYVKMVPSGTVNWTMTAGEGVLAVAEVEVLEDAGALAQASVAIYVSGVVVANAERQYSFQANERRAVQIAWLWEGGASTQTVDLRVKDLSGSLTYTDAQIIVWRVHR